MLSSIDFSKRLLAWFDHHGRHYLPWQKTISPYRVWIAEVMLQQTQVATVIPYFERFIQAFPNVTSLANAREDAVLHLWTGLGYYARARNIHQAAQIIRDQHHGQFPATIESIRALPGIGRSTAGAICSIGWQQRAAILDGNVKRILCRVHAIEGSLTTASSQARLWALAEHYTPTERVADYTQAIMDLGATVCRRDKPDCARCPLNNLCLAYQQERQSELPQRKLKQILPLKNIHLLVLVNEQQQVLLEKRPAHGIWGGLWSLPEYQGNAEHIQDWCAQRFCCHVKVQTHLAGFRHRFSHFQLDIQPLLLAVSIAAPLIMEDEQRIWYNIHKPDVRGLAAPIKKLLERLTDVNTQCLLSEIKAKS